MNDEKKNAYRSYRLIVSIVASVVSMIDFVGVLGRKVVVEEEEIPPFPGLCGEFFQVKIGVMQSP